MRGHICRTVRDTVLGYANWRPSFVQSHVWLCRKTPLLLFSIKWMSSITEPNSLTVSYLENSCGLSPKDALYVSKKVHFETTEKPNSVIAFLKSHGFSQTDISRIIRTRPGLLSYNVEKILLPKVEYLYSRGFSTRDLRNIFLLNNLFLRSLEKHIIPSFDYLTGMFKSAQIANDVVRRNPSIIVFDVQTCLTPFVDILRDIGVPEQKVLLLLRLWRCPNRISLNGLKNGVIEIKELGFNLQTSKFVQAVSIKLYGKTCWESRVNIYRRWGWSEEQVLAAFRAHPLCMAASENKIMAVMDFLVNKMNIDSSAIAKCSDVMHYSLEKRLIPRAAVFQLLCSKGLVSRKNASLLTFFKIPENRFRALLSSYVEAPELLKPYLGKHLYQKRGTPLVTDIFSVVC